MSVTIHLTPEKEALLKAQAQSNGLSVEGWLLALADRAAELEPPNHNIRFANLSDLLLNSPFSGANLNLDRATDFPRHSEIE